MVIGLFTAIQIYDEMPLMAKRLNWIKNDNEDYHDA